MRETYIPCYTLMSVITHFGIQTLSYSTIHDMRFTLVLHKSLFET